jgi:hypothetical protein
MNLVKLSAEFIERLYVAVSICSLRRGILANLFNPRFFIFRYVCRLYVTTFGECERLRHFESNGSTALGLSIASARVRRTNGSECDCTIPPPLSILQQEAHGSGNVHETQPASGDATPVGGAKEATAWYFGALPRESTIGRSKRDDSADATLDFPEVRQP